MSDIFHYITNDVVPGPKGDLLPVDGITLGKQRVLRRLLTNPGDVIFHPQYGAGLPALIGQPVSAAEVEGIVRKQMLLESAVSQSPSPQVSVSFTTGGAFYVTISYTDSGTGSPQTLAFNVDK